MTWRLHPLWPRWQAAFGALRQRFRTAGRSPRTGRGDAEWRRDPLSHPALQAMTPRELGDLPFDPRDVAEE